MTNREKVYQLCKRGAYAQDIADKTGLKMSTVFGHIKFLRENGFVESNYGVKSGTPVRYIATKKRGSVSLEVVPVDAPPKRINRDIDWFWPRMVMR